MFSNLVSEWHGRFYSTVPTSRGMEIAPTVSLAMKTVLGIEDPGVADLILKFACDEETKANQNVQWFKEEWEMSRDEAWGQLGELKTVNGTTLVGTAQCGFSSMNVPFKFEMVGSYPAGWRSRFRGSSSGRTYSPDEVLWHVTVLPEYEWLSGAKNLDEYGIASSITSVLDEYACPVVA